MSADCLNEAMCAVFGVFDAFNATGDDWSMFIAGDARRDWNESAVCGCIGRLFADALEIGVKREL